MRRKAGYYPRRWTKQAIYCYKIGAVCSECMYNIPLESIKQCQVKNAILELVRLYGAPGEAALLEEEGLKRCPKCGEIKDLSEFTHVPGKPRASYCRSCNNEMNKEYRRKKGKIK